MENCPFHHSNLLGHQCLSCPSPTATIAHDNTSCFSNEFSQPNYQLLSNASIHNMARTSCKRRKKQKKNDDDDDEDNRKRGYIHVRARRGEATDSHSLAERVRREKISEKMKTLQAIVPGCDKVMKFLSMEITGKAHMLDEVINYVHYLQNEVQILSLKLASVNPLLYEVEADFDAFMLESHQNNADLLLEWGEQRQELDDPFSILNSFNSF